MAVLVTFKPKITKWIYFTRNLL